MCGEHQESATALVEGGRGAGADGVILEVMELDPPHRHYNRVKRVAVEPTTAS